MNILPGYLLASIGIQAGGTALGQRPTIAALGFESVLGGTMATLAGAFCGWVG